MGILDIFSRTLDDHPAGAPDMGRGPCATLKENGIDPSGLKFTLNQDGSVTVSGHAADRSESDRICRVVGTMPLVMGVRNNLIIAGTNPAAQAEAAGIETASSAGKPHAQPAPGGEPSRIPRAASKVYKQAG